MLSASINTDRPLFHPSSVRAVTTGQGDFAAQLAAAQASDVPQAGQVQQAFPPADAPQAFKDAWSKTTANLDPRLRMTMELKMGSAARGILPGATHAANQPTGSATDYAGLVDKMVASTQFGLDQAQSQTQRAFGGAMLAAFQSLQTALSAS